MKENKNGMHKRTSKEQTVFRRHVYVVLDLEWQYLPYLYNIYPTVFLERNRCTKTPWRSNLFTFRGHSKTDAFEAKQSLDNNVLYLLVSLSKDQIHLEVIVTDTIVERMHLRSNKVGIKCFFIQSSVFRNVKIWMQLTLCLGIFSSSSHMMTSFMPLMVYHGNGQPINSVCWALSQYNIIYIV